MDSKLLILSKTQQHIVLSLLWFYMLQVAFQHQSLLLVWKIGLSGFLSQQTGSEALGWQVTEAANSLHPPPQSQES